MTTYSAADSFLRDVLQAAPTDPVARVAHLREAFLKYVLTHSSKTDDEVEVEIDDANDKASVADDARKEAVMALEVRTKERDDARIEITKLVLERTHLQNDLAETRHQLRNGAPIDVEALIRKHDNVVRIAFGDNAKRAEASYRKAVKIDDDDHNIDEALSLYRQCLSLNPNHDLAWTNMGNLYFRKQDNAKARACYDKALNIRPTQPEAHYNIGYMLMTTNDPVHNDEIERHFKVAIGADPTFADAHYNLGMLYTRIGDSVHGRAAFETYLELEPDTAFADDVRRMLRKKRK